VPAMRSTLPMAGLAGARSWTPSIDGRRLPPGRSAPSLVPSRASPPRPAGPPQIDIHTLSVYNRMEGERGGSISMHRRVNITLPEETLALMDRVVTKGDRSRLVDEAVRHFLRARSRARLRKLIAEGARARAPRDRALAREWFPIEEQPSRGRFG